MALGAIGMLFYYIGISAFASVIVMLLMIPLTKNIAKKFIHLEDEMMSLRDKRVTLMTQVLNAIRIVKYFAWEKSIENEVMEIRNIELETRRKLAKSQVLSGVTYTATSTIVLFVALMTHHLRGEKIDAALIFTCVSLFGILEGPLGELSHLLSRLTNSFVGTKRILYYLDEEIVENNKVINIEQSTSGIKIENLNCYYENPNELVLKNINLVIPKGTTCAIVGAVGAGKSSLLYAILNEIKISSGKIIFPDFENNLRPQTAYLPQEAYIVNETLKSNIYFGEEENNILLNRAIYCSVLENDIREFSSGINTEIGEKGVNLSGGQKQRVGLARAVLAHPQLLLLDDPLSAVDDKTENLLCERLIFGEWKDKTRIVVTHRLGHLREFDQIVFLVNGKIVANGTFEDLIISSDLFKKFYENHDEENELQTGINPEQSKSSHVIDNNNFRITEDEDKEVGAVKKSIYFDYIKSLGGDNLKHRNFILGLLFFGAASTSFLPLIQKSWLSYFSSHENIWGPRQGIIIYGILGLIILLIGMANSFLWLDRGITASRILHDKMLKSVLLAPIRFFDSTPVGRILQRFSRDVESVDVYLQWSFISVISCILQVIVALLLIISMMPLMILIILPLLIVYYFIQRDYRFSAREAKRFDSISRSPRYAHFKETLQGLTVIRSLGKENWFIENFYLKLIESQRMFYSHYMLNRWFSSRIPLIGGLISIATSIGVALSSRYGLINAGFAGLIIIYSLSFWSYLNWGIRVFADIESRMTSVERLKFFASLEPEEKNILLADDHLPPNWPLHGAISIKNIKVRYAAHLPLVLKDISFNIMAGSKVGIMGRTGSGKSTLFQSLFRFIELEEGSILIDGIDTKTISLNRLRKSMAIIPQDPTLFMGTIRSNLDRFNEFSDDELKRVLVQSGLYEFIHKLPNGIDTIVNENGNNLSQGQRQLLCLSRALLIKAKIIVMDEATASVDVSTDALIQKVIREELKNITLIVIAHRLSTIKDCDQIIELQNGQIANISHA
jgi:ABC-type multidrug transport system fused ATPase/permease subunit